MLDSDRRSVSPTKYPRETLNDCCVSRRFHLKLILLQKQIERNTMILARCTCIQNGRASCHTIRASLPASDKHLKRAKVLSCLSEWKYSKISYVIPEPDFVKANHERLAPKSNLLTECDKKQYTIWIINITLWSSLLHSLEQKPVFRLLCLIRLSSKIGVELRNEYRVVLSSDCRWVLNL